MGDDALNVSLCHQSQTRRGDFVDQQVGAGAVFHHVFVVPRVAGDDDETSAIVDAVAIGRLDGIAGVPPAGAAPRFPSAARTLGLKSAILIASSAPISTKWPASGIVMIRSPKPPVRGSSGCVTPCHG